jgi:hypothetical protein
LVEVVGVGDRRTQRAQAVGNRRRRHAAVWQVHRDEDDVDVLEPPNLRHALRHSSHEDALTAKGDEVAVCDAFRVEGVTWDEIVRRHGFDRHARHLSPLSVRQHDAVWDLGPPGGRHHDRRPGFPHLRDGRGIEVVRTGVGIGDQDEIGRLRRVDADARPRIHLNDLPGMFNLDTRVGQRPDADGAAGCFQAIVGSDQRGGHGQARRGEEAESHETDTIDVSMHDAFASGRRRGFYPGSRNATISPL